MLLLPFLPQYILRGNFREPPLEVFTLNTLKPFPVRIPERSALAVIQHKSIIIRPA